MIKFKIIDVDIKPPVRATKGSAGIDLRLSSIKMYEKGVYTLGLGVAVEIPDQHFGLLAVRSSTGSKGLQLTNSVGIIDSDYRGELMMKCTFTHRGVDFPEVGDRIAQLIISPCLVDDVMLSYDLGATERGDGSYGSTNS